MVRLCQRVLDGKGILDKCKSSIVAPIFKEKGDVMRCESYRGVKLLWKTIEQMLEKMRALVNLDETQFGWKTYRWMHYL